MSSTGKLTEEQIAALQADFRGTALTIAALGRKYGVDRSTVRWHTRTMTRDLEQAATNLTQNLIAEAIAGVGEDAPPSPGDDLPAPAVSTEPPRLSYVPKLRPRTTRERVEQLLADATGDGLEVIARIAELRATLTISQLQRLHRHAQLLSTVDDLLADYFGDDDARRVRAARLLFPTQGDSLQALLRTLSRSRVELIELERLVGGMNAPDPASGPATAPAREALKTMSTDQLSTLHSAIQLLRQGEDAGRALPLPPSTETLQ